MPATRRSFAVNVGARSKPGWPWRASSCWYNGSAVSSASLHCGYRAAMPETIGLPWVVAQYM